jgi:hypothetical protein
MIRVLYLLVDQSHNMELDDHDCVDVPSTLSISELKKRIRDEQIRNCRDFDPESFIVYRPVPALDDGASEHQVRAVFENSNFTKVTAGETVEGLGDEILLVELPRRLSFFPLVPP